MKFIKFEKRIDETVQDLIDKLEESEDVRLYFSTQGGQVNYMNYLIDYLNTREDIEIILDGYLCSAGYNLVLYTHCPIIMAPSFQETILHLIDSSISFRDDKESGGIFTQNLEEWNTDYIKDVKDSGLDPEKVERIWGGGEVTFSKQEISLVLDKRNKRLNGTEKETV